MRRSGSLEHHHNIELPNIPPYRLGKYEMYNMCMEIFQVLKCNVIIEISYTQTYPPCPYNFTLGSQIIMFVDKVMQV
jgi:hypothetical protein